MWRHQIRRSFHKSALKIPLGVWMAPWQQNTMVTTLTMDGGKAAKLLAWKWTTVSVFFGNLENEALIAYPWWRKQMKLEGGYRTNYSLCLYFFAIFAAVLQWLQWIFCPLPGSSHSSMSPLRKRHSQQYPESLRKPTHECFWTNWQSHRRQKLPNCKQ